MKNLIKGLTTMSFIFVLSMMFGVVNVSAARVDVDTLNKTNVPESAASKYMYKCDKTLTNGWTTKCETYSYYYTYPSGSQSTASGDNKIAVYNSNNEKVWEMADITSGENQDAYFAEGFVQDNDGNIVAYGNRFVKNLTERKYYITIYKYDINGNIIWKTEYESNETYITSVVKDLDGGYLLGGFGKSSEFLTSTNNDSDDAFILKIDKDGNIKWQKTYGGSNNEMAFDLISVSDDLLLMPITSFSNDFEGITDYNTEYTPIMLLLDYNGNIINSKSFVDLDNANFYVFSKSQDNTIQIFGVNNNGLFLLPVTITYDYRNINIVPNTNGSVEVDGKHKKGDVVKLNITPNKGYQIKFIKVLDEGKKEVKVTNNSFIMPDSDINVQVEYENVIYSFTDGKDAVYNNTYLTFKLNGLLELLDKVYVNGKELSTYNYTTESGSTIITLKDEYLKTLDAGTYDLKVTYTNGSEDTTTFKINEKTSDKVVEDEVKEENPKTFDGILLYVGLGILSVIGLSGTGLYIKKSFN